MERQGRIGQGAVVQFRENVGQLAAVVQGGGNCNERRGLAIQSAPDFGGEGCQGRLDTWDSQSLSDIEHGVEQLKAADLHPGGRLHPATM